MAADTITQFHVRRALGDNEGYYVTRWDRAVPFVVVAETQTAAFAEVKRISGTPPRGRYWALILDRVEQVPTPTDSGAHAAPAADDCTT